MRLSSFRDRFSSHSQEFDIFTTDWSTGSVGSDVAVAGALRHRLGHHNLFCNLWSGARVTGRMDEGLLA